MVVLYLGFESQIFEDLKLETFIHLYGTIESAFLECGYAD